MPKVSIIVLTYNRKDYLTETIQSILNQTFTDFELLIIDNFSNYDFLAHIQIFNDKRIRAFQHANGGNLSVNRNFGIRQAQGEYIAFCDDDDLWLPEKLEKQLQIFEKHPDLNLVGTNATIFPKMQKNSLYMWRDEVISYTKLLKRPQGYLRITGIMCSSVLYKASLTKKIGYWNENQQIVAMEDYDYWLRILKHQNNSIYIINKDLLKYRWHTNNMIQQKQLTKPTYYDRLAIIYAKQKEPLADKLAQKLPYLENVLRIKISYYDNNISFQDVLQTSKISFIDKIIILFKKFILSII